MPDSGWVERATREPAAFPGIVVLADGRRFPITITNVSAGGCQIQCGATLPIGAEINLVIGRELIAADVRWAIDGRAGLRMRKQETRPASRG